MHDAVECTGAFIAGMTVGLTVRYWYPRLEHLEAQAYAAARVIRSAWNTRREI